MLTEGLLKPATDIKYCDVTFGNLSGFRLRIKSQNVLYLEKKLKQNVVFCEIPLIKIYKNSILKIYIIEIFKNNFNTGAVHELVFQLSFSKQKILNWQEKWSQFSRGKKPPTQTLSYYQSTNHYRRISYKRNRFVKNNKLDFNSWIPGLSYNFRSKLD